MQHAFITSLFFGRKDHILLVVVDEVEEVLLDPRQVAAHLVVWVMDDILDSFGDFNISSERNGVSTALEIVERVVLEILLLLRFLRARQFMRAHTEFFSNRAYLICTFWMYFCGDSIRSLNWRRGCTTKLGGLQDAGAHAFE